MYLPSTRAFYDGGKIDPTLALLALLALLATPATLATRVVAESRDGKKPWLSGRQIAIYFI